MTREEIIAANPLARFLVERDCELRPAGATFATNACPVAPHKKYHRPVTIDTEKNLWHCNDCKRGGSIIEWLMMEKGITAADAMRELSGRDDGSSELCELVATYDYTDESGKLLYQCCRYEPKKFRQRRPDGKGGWIWNLHGVRRVLYYLPDIITAQRVCVTEGEKDADNLCSLGFTATTNPCGAGKWRDEFSETLRGKEVVVFGDIGDEDRAGDRHVERVICSLIAKAKSIKRVTLPDGFHDVSDYIASFRPEIASEIIRKLIDETPEVEAHSLCFTELESVELPPPPYVPPPLDLLPSVLQDYVHAAGGSLNVDVSFILLPLLSALGSAIGNSRSIFLKRGFVQPPVIWTNIVGRSGSRKSPALEKATFAVMEHERELVRQNKQAMEIYENALAESKSKKERGVKPKPPAWQSCMADDLTLAVLAEAIELNPRGLLVRRDELSGWYSSFDQFSNAKGSDVSRWLSLHTGESFAFDRRSDKRHYRLWQPRVSITGGIQPRVLRRVLTEDFFERGLPARFLFAYPPMQQDKWSETEISDDLRARVLELFGKLWLLQPESDDHDQPRPKLLSPDSDAQAEYVRYYNECGASAVQADEHEEAAWCKLTGYAARLALVGQLAHKPDAEIVTREVMHAACDLARWFGNEAVRVYAELAETRQQMEQRELIEFIERRGCAVYEREVMQSFTRLKNDKSGTDRELTALVKAGRGKWEPVDHGGGPGRPARKFRLFRSSTSTQFGISRRKTDNTVDVDDRSSQKITPLVEPDKETATLIGDELNVARL